LENFKISFLIAGKTAYANNYQAAINCRNAACLLLMYCGAVNFLMSCSKIAFSSFSTDFSETVDLVVVVFITGIF